MTTLALVNKEGEEIIPSTISGVVQATNVTQLDRLKLVLLGDPGSGKSWLASTGRKPILVYDFDDRGESIAGKPGVYIKTLVDLDQKNPTAWSELEKDLGVLEYEKQKGTLKIKTIVIDSLTFLLKAAQNQLMKDQAHLGRGLRIGTKEYFITQGWDSVNGTQRMIEGLFNRLFELKIDVICCMHIRREKDAASTEKNPIFTDKYTCEPQNMKLLLPKFNERWMMQDMFRVQTKPDSQFNATTALNIDGIEDANIEKILEKHERNTKLAANTAK
jgi:hypothetical protein